MLNWDKNVIEYLDRAEIYSHFAENVLAAIKPYLKKYKNVLEIGCGIGNISIEFSKMFELVTCMDISDEAISSVKLKIVKKNIKNIVAKVLDSKCTLKGKYDLIFASFFFEQDDFIRIIKENLLDDGVAIYIFRKDKKHTIMSNKISDKDSFYQLFEEKLLKEKLPYKRLEFVFHKDQPFIDDDDIKKFCKLYSSDFEEYKRNVKIIDSDLYKYVYEVKREAYIYIIKKESDNAYK